MTAMDKSVCITFTGLMLLAVSACRCGGSSSHQYETDHARIPATSPSLGTAPADPWVPGDPGKADVFIDVNTHLEPHPISPMIYGINDDLKAVREQRWGVMRFGGNRSTAYNWETNASNAGSDYLFQNDSLVSDSSAPAKPLLDLIDAASSIAAATVITIACTDYVAGDKRGDGDVRRSGPDYLRTRFKANHARKGRPFAASPDPNDADVYQDELVAFLKAQRPAARILLSMDNEPDLWALTHAEIVRQPVTYEEVWRRNRAFSQAAKAVWPGIEVLGVVSFGYSGYLDLQRAPDAQNRLFLDWYLTQARAAERSLGKRLIDYLDLHWYPEARGGGERITEAGTSRAVVIAREQAPRSLWDPRYAEESWVADKHGGPVDLLHWLQNKVERFYPGTKLAFSEWNYGAGGHISGAIAVADVLGIFGKFGVGVSNYWPLHGDESFAWAAFRAYRNYDGLGSAFGDTSVSATSSQSELVTVYASTQSDQPERVVLVAINKDFVPRTAGIRISHARELSKARVYVLASAKPALVDTGELQVVATNAFRFELPPQSVSVVVSVR